MLMMSTKDGPAISMRAYHETAEGIASSLSQQVNLPVRDATGRKGKFDFTLYWLIRPTRQSMSAASTDPKRLPKSRALLGRLSIVRGDPAATRPQTGTEERPGCRSW